MKHYGLCSRLFEERESSAVETRYVKAEGAPSLAHRLDARSPPRGLGRRTVLAAKGDGGFLCRKSKSSTFYSWDTGGLRPLQSAAFGKARRQLLVMYAPRVGPVVLCFVLFSYSAVLLAVPRFVLSTKHIVAHTVLGPLIV